MLGQAVHRLLEESGRRVRVAVRAGVHRRVAQPEIGGEIDDLEAALEQGGHDRHRLDVRKRDEDRLDARGQQRQVRGAEDHLGEVAQRREHLSRRHARVLAGGGPADPQRGVTAEQPEQLAAGVAARPDDPDFVHHAATLPSRGTTASPQPKKRTGEEAVASSPAEKRDFALSAC